MAKSSSWRNPFSYHSAGHRLIFWFVQFCKSCEYLERTRLVTFWMLSRFILDAIRVPFGTPFSELLNQFLINLPPEFISADQKPKQMACLCVKIKSCVRL